MIVAALIREIIHYEPESGVMTWHPRSLNWFPSARIMKGWNSRLAGKSALDCRDAYGYRVGRIQNRMYKAHRVAWAYYYGEWPEKHIDHVNHDRADNRIENLRAVDSAGNQRNMARFRTNTSGVTGVYWHKGSEKWTAQVSVEGASQYLGIFPTLDDAANARASAERLYGFHENHGKTVEFIPQIA